MPVKDREELNKKSIILDTCSVNQILKNKNLSIKFFNKIQSIDGIAAIPRTAFLEISSDIKTFNKFKNIYSTEDRLRIIGESCRELIEREIDKPVKSNLYLPKDISFSNITNKMNLEENQSNKEKKKSWKKNCKEKHKEFKEYFKVDSKECNKQMSDLLREDKFLINYMNAKDYFVLNFLKNDFKIKIEIPKNQIYSNKNRYKYINLLQCLMLINMGKSFCSGKSEFSSAPGDMFDIDIASFSAYSYCFISEDEKLVQSLQKVKNNSKEIGFENKYKVYYKIENFCQDIF